MPLQCIVFDCDGVILDSVPVKTKAFARLAEPYGAEARDRFVMYHTVHGGVSRYKKFEWFFSEILDREITKEESISWGEKFTEYALDEVRKCKLISGAADVLDYWHKRLPLYVCSGTPTGELRTILKERGLATYFAGIFGSPPGKAELLAKIVRQAKLEPESTLMVGDSPTDWDAAEYAGTMFYGVGHELEGGPFPWCNDLTEFHEWIKKHVVSS